MVVERNIPVRFRVKLNRLIGPLCIDCRGKIIVTFMR